MRLNSKYSIIIVLSAFVGIVLLSYWLYNRSLTANIVDRRDILSDIKYWGEMNVGTNAIHPPMEFLDKGEPAGLDVDLANHIGRQIGVSTNIIPFQEEGSNNEVIAALRSKEIDMIISSISPTYQFSDEFDVSDPYQGSDGEEYVIVFRSGDDELRNAVNLALATLRQKGTLDELREKWFADVQ